MVRKHAQLENDNVQLTERLACLKIMGAKLRAYLEPLEHHIIMVSRSVRETLNWAALCRKAQCFRIAEIKYSSLDTIHREKFCVIKNDIFMLLIVS